MTADPDVIGYLCQCDLCGQRALTRTPHPHANPFICSRCREVHS